MINERISSFLLIIIRKTLIFFLLASTQVCFSLRSGPHCWAWQVHTWERSFVQQLRGMTFHISTCRTASAGNNYLFHIVNVTVNNTITPISINFTENFRQNYSCSYRIVVWKLACSALSPYNLSVYYFMLFFISCSTKLIRKCPSAQQQLNLYIDPRKTMWWNLGLSKSIFVYHVHSWLVVHRIHTLLSTFSAGLQQWCKDIRLELESLRVTILSDSTRLEFDTKK